MWSGPRNISTTLMRSFEHREDTFVSDEPFYAYYLKQTGVDHPGRDEIIAAQETDWRKVAAYLTGPAPRDKSVWYQKHMTHHFLPEINEAWMKRVVNCFLIRDPYEVLLSYKNVIQGEITALDIGFPQQIGIFEYVWRITKTKPLVIDARDVQENPRGLLTALCAATGIPFTERMLSWPPGRRDTDGVWAKYWYDNVERSTGFLPYKPKTEPLPEALKPVLEECRPIYEEMSRHRLGA